MSVEKKEGNFLTTYRSFRYFCKKSDQSNLSRRLANGLTNELMN